MGGGAIRVHTLSSSFLAYIQLYDRIGIMQDEISITKSKIRKRLVNAFGIKICKTSISSLPRAHSYLLQWYRMLRSDPLAVECIDKPVIKPCHQC